MKKNLILALCLVCAFSAIQNSTAQTSPKPAKSKTLTRGDEIGSIIGTTSDAIYAVEGNRNSMSGLYHYNITKLDKLTLKNLWVNKNFDVDAPNAFISNDQLVLLGAEDKNEKIVLDLFTPNQKGEFSKVGEYPTPIKSEKILASSQAKNTWNAKESLRAENFLSEDGSKLLIISYLRSKNLKKMADEMYVKIINTKTFELIWEMQIPESYKSKNIFSYNFKIDNEGNIYYMFGYIENDDFYDVKNVICRTDAEKKSKYFSFDVGAYTLNRFLFDHDGGPSNSWEKINNEADYAFTSEGIRVTYILRNQGKGVKHNATFHTLTLDKSDLKVISKSDEDFPAIVEEKLKAMSIKGADASGEFNYNISNTFEFPSCTYITLRVLIVHKLDHNGWGTIVFKLNKEGKITDTELLLKPADDVLLKSYPVYKTGNTYQMALEMNLRERKQCVKWSTDAFKNISMEPDDNIILFEIAEQGVTKVNSFPLERGLEFDSYEQTFTRENKPLIISHQGIQYYMKFLDIK